MFDIASGLFCDDNEEITDRVAEKKSDFSDWCLQKYKWWGDGVRMKNVKIMITSQLIESLQKQTFQWYEVWRRNCIIALNIPQECSQDSNGET